MPKPSQARPTTKSVEPNSSAPNPKSRAPRRRVAKWSETRSKSKNAAPRRSPNRPKQTKLQILIGLLRRPQGATINDAVRATGWQAHSVRGAISGALKKKLGLVVASEKSADRGRVYRIEAGGQGDIRSASAR
jgi:hypothetical protein